MDLVDLLGRYNFEDYSTPYANTVINKVLPLRKFGVTIEGKIILLVTPPGLGKTSERTDVAENMGHRRTYGCCVSAFAFMCPCLLRCSWFHGGVNCKACVSMPRGLTTPIHQCPPIWSRMIWAPLATNPNQPASASVPCPPQRGPSQATKISDEQALMYAPIHIFLHLTQRILLPKASCSSRPIHFSQIQITTTTTTRRGWLVLYGDLR